jgi:hypothetical protein
MSLGALAVGGHVSLIGASLTPSGTGLDPLLLTGRGITLGSISVGSRTDFEAMNRAIAIYGLHPVIDRTFPFAQAKERTDTSRPAAISAFRQGRDHRYGLRRQSARSQVLTANGNEISVVGAANRTAFG